MQTAQEEEYVFFRFASGDMLQAISFLKQLNRYKKQGTRNAFLQQAILAYCRPFKSCNGIYGKYKLTASFIPQEHIELHKKLTKYRDQVFAHSDLTVRKPTLKKWRTEKDINMYPISFKGLWTSELEKVIPEMKLLIGKVIKRINQQTLTLEKWLT